MRKCKGTITSFDDFMEIVKPYKEYIVYQSIKGDGGADGLAELHIMSTDELYYCIPDDLLKNIVLVVPLLSSMLSSNTLIRFIPLQMAQKEAAIYYEKYQQQNA
jgi:hypothetical protein